MFMLISKTKMTVQTELLPVELTEPSRHEPTFEQLPEEWAWVREQLVTASRGSDLADTYGVSEDVDSILLFHGTQRDRTEHIASEGMKGFKEKSWADPRIFVTTSPTMALHHATDRGPHDTLRAEGISDYQHKPEDAVLLSIRIPKAWLLAQPEIAEPSPLPESLKRAVGILPENDTRLHSFANVFSDEVATLQRGEETSDFGIVFPVNNIPPEFVTVIESTDPQPLFD